MPNINGGSDDSAIQKTQNMEVVGDLTNFLGELKLNGNDIGGGGSGGIEVGTKAELLAKTGMSAGSQFFVNANAGTAFTSQENKLWT
jgi:hypothetical protein